MATRVGKYKMSKRDSALSLEDGGTIAGSLTVTGADIKFSGFSLQAGAATTSDKLFITGSSGITGSGTSYKVLCIG
jgi:hypothetical protein